MRNRGATRKTLRQEKERKKKQGELLFAVFLVVLPEATHIPLVPLGIVLWSLAWLIGMHLLAGLECFNEWTIAQKLVCVLYLTIAVGELSASPLHRKWRDEKASQISGELITPQGRAGDPINVAIMPNSKWKWEGPKDKAQFGFPQGAEFNLRRNEKGKLLINTEVFDRSGKVVVTIQDNVWTVNPSTSICWDKNYTDDTLEVKDGRDRVILQLRIYPDVVWFNGEWWDEYGAGARIVDGQFVEMNPNRHPDQPSIKPLFKYPSKGNWAEWQPIG